MTTTIQSLTIKTEAAIRDDFLRTYRNGLIKRGVPDPDVSEGTEIFNKATGLAQQIYAATVNVPLAADAQMADSALGDDLVRIAAIYKLFLHPAGPSAGPLVFTATVTSSTALGFTQGAQLIDPSGNTYEVAVGGQYTATGPPIPIRAIAVGAATNLAAGVVLRWVQPPPFVNTTATVGTGGLTGGVDAEDIEGLRARLLKRLQTPPNGDNWPSLVQDAEQASTAVQKGFAYPACNGPSTEHVAVVRAPTPTNKNRDVDAPTMTAVITPAVLAARPQYVETVVTTVQNYPVSVSFGLALPASTLASPAGPGGGWTEAAPFPVWAANFFTGAQVVTSSTSFTVESDNAPVAGAQVCWLSRDDWTLRTAKVLTFSGGPIYSITIDTPFVSVNGVSIAPGDFVFPNAYRMAAYVAGVLAGFAKMGPYEKTNLSALLQRATRRPLAASTWPSSLAAPFLRNLTDAGDEVGSASYLYRSAITPPLPAAISNGPYIMVPSQIGIYPI